MLGEHFGSMCLISALTTQSLTCNIKSKKGVNNAAKKSTGKQKINRPHDFMISAVFGVKNDLFARNRS
jgi:hypothetical protein